MDYIGLGILSLFCFGGLYAYVREVRRLNKLLRRGATTMATVLEKERLDSGSETVTHFLVTYRFVDEDGNSVVDKEDLNSRAFFNKLAIGDAVEILYQRGDRSNSYPVSQIGRDLRIAKWICFAIVFFWGSIALLIISRG